jgi:hypothetical protein
MLDRLDRYRTRTLAWRGRLCFPWYSLRREVEMQRALGLTEGNVGVLCEVDISRSSFLFPGDDALGAECGSGFGGEDVDTDDSASGREPVDGNREDVVDEV